MSLEPVLSFLPILEGISEAKHTFVPVHARDAPLHVFALQTFLAI